MKVETNVKFKLHTNFPTSAERFWGWWLFFGSWTKSIHNPAIDIPIAVVGRDSSSLTTSLTCTAGLSRLVIRKITDFQIQAGYRVVRRVEVVVVGQVFAGARITVVLLFWEGKNLNETSELVQKVAPSGHDRYPKEGRERVTPHSYYGVSCGWPPRNSVALDVEHDKRRKWGGRWCVIWDRW